MDKTGCNKHLSGEGLHADVELTVGLWTTVQELLESAATAASSYLKLQIDCLKALADPVGERLLTMPVDALNLTSNKQFEDEWLDKLKDGTVDNAFCRWMVKTLSPHFETRA